MITGQEFCECIAEMLKNVIVCRGLEEKKKNFVGGREKNTKTVVIWRKIVYNCRCEGVFPKRKDV